MFGLSVWEIFTLLVVTLLVVGPERMPGLARSVGEWVVKIRRFVANAKAEMDSEFNTAELKKLLNSQEQELENLRKLMEDTKRDVEDSGRYLLKAVDDVKNKATASGSELSDKLTDALNRQPATSSDKDKPAALSDRPSAEQAAQPQAAQSDAHASVDSEDDFETLLRRAEETFSRPFSPPDPKPAPEPKSRELQPVEHNEPKERRD